MVPKGGKLERDAGKQSVTAGSSAAGRENSYGSARCGAWQLPLSLAGGEAAELLSGMYCFNF